MVTSQAKATAAIGSRRGFLRGIAASIAVTSLTSLPKLPLIATIDVGFASLNTSDIIKSNTLNPFAIGSSEDLVQMIVGVMDEIGDKGMWSIQARELLSEYELKYIPEINPDWFDSLFATYGNTSEIRVITRTIELICCNYSDDPETIRINRDQSIEGISKTLEK